MFFKRFLNIMILVLFVFLFVGAVSANDGELNDFNSAVVDSIDDGVLKSSSVMNDESIDASRSAGNSIYVDVSAGGNGDGSSTNPYNNLQSALDNAVDDGSILIAPGTYKGTGNVNLKVSQNNLIISGLGPGVIFDGENINQIFNITGLNVTIQRITFKNANATDGGAIYAS